MASGTFELAAWCIQRFREIITKELRAYLHRHWRSLKPSLLDGSYRPEAFKRVEIPKPHGGKRLLGIPTVLDRLIQRALLRVLTHRFSILIFRRAATGFALVAEAKMR